MTWKISPTRTQPLLDHLWSPSPMSDESAIFSYIHNHKIIMVGKHLWDLEHLLDTSLAGTAGLPPAWHWFPILQGPKPDTVLQIQASNKREGSLHGAVSYTLTSTIQGKSDKLRSLIVTSKYHRTMAWEKIQEAEVSDRKELSRSQCHKLRGTAITMSQR